ncbi:hypothetical protein ATN00_10510 [Sphingobium baderi]|uniref:Uncharacterized protein n=1 Tax=Sphingobium baderi TaxID=1332080 RepID=A0A0S3EZ09_9SPHN|nr:hypothetical protein [Sphingobium baderi]ALR20666.1 hypothetical protein ATN00_10510 [Sphingobium baderi]
MSDGEITHQLRKPPPGIFQSAIALGNAVARDWAHHASGSICVHCKICDARALQLGLNGCSTGIDELIKGTLGGFVHSPDEAEIGFATVRPDSPETDVPTPVGDVQPGLEPVDPHPDLAWAIKAAHVVTPEQRHQVVMICRIRHGCTDRIAVAQFAEEVDRCSTGRPGPSITEAYRFSCHSCLKGGSFLEVAGRLGCGREYLADLLRTSYLAPSIIQAILEGRQPANLSRKRLVQTNRIPLGWCEQETLFGFS